MNDKNSASRRRRLSAFFAASLALLALGAASRAFAQEPGAAQAPGDNCIWVLTAGFLVMFMQAGFALLETGFCRAKNASHIFFMNFAVYFLGVAGYWACGFALQGPNSTGLVPLGLAAPGPGGGITLAGHFFDLYGRHGFFLDVSSSGMGIFALFLFQLMFMDTAATIPTGALAERWKTSNFLMFCVWMSALVYPLYAHWMWGGGWLSRLGADFGLGHGAVDFAGSSVVHLIGGSAALAGAWILGPRAGKYDKHGRAVPIPGHNLPMALLGIFILAFGWFGFNAGSTLNASEPRVALVEVNTVLASAAGAMGSLAYVFFKTRKFDPATTANGFLAGLVSITGACAFVPTWSAFLIGAVGGVLAGLASSVLENLLGVDDPVGAIAVHGAGGAWGLISVGLFADGTFGAGANGVGAAQYLGQAGRGVCGLFYGDPSQLGAQVVALLACLAWSMGACALFFKATQKLWGIRIPRELEQDGLDIPECGNLAYPEFPIRKV